MFDFRYHAISLVAVFLALGIGILLGVTIGDSLVSEADRGLRESLREDVVEAREERAVAGEGLEERDRFIDEALPMLAGGRIAGERVAVVGLGSLPEDMVASIRKAVEAGGGRLDSVSSFPSPPVDDELVDTLGGRFTGADQDARLAGPLGRRIGRALVNGSGAADRLAAELPDQFSGAYDGASALVVHHAPTEDAQPAAEAFERALLDEAERAGARVVGAEESDTDPSQIPFYSTRGLPSVDSVDLPGGRIALVFALAGADGSFGFKDTADALLPQPPAERPAGVRDRG